MGFGGIGRMIAMHFVTSNKHCTLNIIENDKRVEGAFMDLKHANQTNPNCQIHFNNQSLLNASEYIFHCAGEGVANKANRDSVFTKNAQITSELFKNLKLKQKCKVIVITNPVDAITYCTWKLCGLNKENVVGVGTLLDSLRMDQFLFESTGENFKSLLLGEHGLDLVYIQKELKNKNDYSQTHTLNSSTIESCLAKTIAAAKMIKKNGDASIFGITACALTIFHCFENQLKTTLPVSTVLPKHLEKIFSVKNVALSLPTAISSQGAFPELDIEILPAEKHLLKKAAKKITMTISSLHK